MLCTNDTIISRTILFLRFPLIIAVIFIHTQLNEAIINGITLTNGYKFPIYNLFFHIITNEITQIAVPLFFFISGFLFFYKTSIFNKNEYVKKLKKRFKSLLVPYIFWNLTVLFLVFLSQKFFSSMLSGNNKLIIDYTYTDWLNIFWNHKEGTPICYQFWFIRDLLIVVIFTPLIYYFIKYIKIYGIILLGILWTFNIWFDVVSFSITSFFFFSFGAWFSINKRYFTIYLSHFRWILTIAYVGLLVLNTLLWYYKITEFYYIKNISIIIGMIVIILWVALGLKNNKIQPNEFLAASSFFVYAYHGMPIVLLIKIYMKFTVPYISEWTMIIGYFLIPFIIAYIGVGIYAILHKYFPSFTALITGGR